MSERQGQAYAGTFSWIFILNDEGPFLALALVSPNSDFTIAIVHCVY